MPYGPPCRLSHTRCKLMGSVLIACMLILLAACQAGSSPPPPRSVPPLHLARASELAAVVTLEQQIGVHAPASVAVYQQATGAVSGSAHILFNLGPSLWDMTLTGSGLRQILPFPSDGVGCPGAFAVTPDGQWVACWNERGIGLVRLEDTPAPSVREVLADGTDYRFGTPAWRPDGRQLAVWSTMAGGCSIALYDTSPPYVSFTLAEVLAFSEFLTTSRGGSICEVGWPTWSPDGRWLSLVATEGGKGLIYGIPTALFELPLSARPTAAPTTVPISRAKLHYFGTATSESPPAWTVDAGTLIVISQDQRQIMSITVGTSGTTMPRTIMSVSDDYIYSAALSPDGTHVVFLYGLRGTSDVRPPPARMYSYALGST